MAATRVHQQAGRQSSGQGGFRSRHRFSLPVWTAPVAVCALTALGFSIRLVNLRQGLFGDELSTAWIVHGRSLGKVISLVYSDAEVTPPLSFVLAWLSLKIGSSWEWLRVPSLLAGTATIPIVYAIGVRTAGRRAGLIAAAITTLSAVMIVFSDEARNYAVMMACVAGSTLSLLLALDTRRARWWVVYGLSSCLAMYSHYTAAFVLIVQALWVLWRHPEVRRPALLANLGAAVLYAPWIPGWIRDTHSVTIPIINAVVPFAPGFVVRSTAEWAAGYPYLSVSQAPGRTFALFIAVGLLVGLAGAGLRRSRADAALGKQPRVVTERFVLLVLLAAATLVAECAYSAVGSHVLDSRDLNASWPALAVTVGVVVSMAGPWLGTLAGALILAGYGASAVDTLEPSYQRPNSPAVATFIQSRAQPGDVVVDASNVPVVPLTPLEAYLPRALRVFTLGLPEGPPPYTLASRVPSGRQVVAEAVRAARGRPIFLVTGTLLGEKTVTAVVQGLQARAGAGQVLALLSRRYRLITSRRFPGIETLTVGLLAPAWKASFLGRPTSS
jgi:hypothetical protein